MKKRIGPQKAKVITFGMYAIPYKVRRARCSDGRRRTVYLDMNATSGLPGKVQVYQRASGDQPGRVVTISGFVESGQDGDLEFHAYKFRKNGHILP